MKIAIHKSRNDFSSKWIDYCKKQSINYKLVDCYSNDIISQIEDCDALMWHFHHANSKDVLFAKQLLYSVQMAGKLVFPDFNTAWHFDDKVGQKYLLESIKAPIVPSYVFYEKKEALAWAKNTGYPKVLKLRKGAGSSNVKKIEDFYQAKKVIKKAFGKGFSPYDKWANLKERWYKYGKGLTSSWGVIKGILRFGRSTEFARVSGNERGYIYFQDYIPGNEYDIRVIVINDKAFAIKRLVREDDFRASGSGKVLFDKEHFDEATISLSFEIREKLKSQCLAIDYVYDNGNPLIVEISYGFIKEVYYQCTGYWDRDLNWHQGSFDAQGWMVEGLIKQSKNYSINEM